MKRACKQCGTEFDITDDDLVFYDKVSPIFNGKKELIPAPTLCPSCRSQRRMMWRNERSLYMRPCDFCKKMRVSMLKPNAPYKAYCRECFLSDAWNAEDYGRDYDFSLTLFENFDALLRQTPLMQLYQTGQNENCDYMNFAGPECRNCYLIFNSGRDEDCYYSRGFIESKDCCDMLIGSGDELCYECINCSDCYRLFFSQNCFHCSDSAFLFNCRRCKHCFGCTNLVEKEYYLFNKPCSEADYREVMSQLGSQKFRMSCEEKMRKMKLECIHRASSNINTEGCTGDYTVESKNCIECYEVKGGEDCKWLTCSKLCKDSYDLFGYGYDSQLLYENCGVGRSSNVTFSFASDLASDSYFSVYCENVKHCFACVSLRHKEYCILNKQYSKEDYESLVQKIVEQMQMTGLWGEFFPAELSPFCYNETVAQEYFPLTKSEVLQRGWRWNGEESLRPNVEKIIQTKDLPDSIDDVPDDILNWAITCESTGMPFRITKAELDFYRKMVLPIPRFHPDERHRARMALSNPRHLYKRACSKCHKTINTSYAPGRPEIVYCEECYLETVY